MAILRIYTFGEAVLRQVAKPVAQITPELKQLAEDMLETMYDAPGVGLAAPQVGHSIRLMVVDCAEEGSEKQPLVFFNPEIIPETEPVCMEEGCLSVPGIYAEVTRPEVITVQAQDINGDAFKLTGVSGLLSRCIQHEVDHLNGVLFVDKLRPADRAMFANKLKKMAKNK
jgi:peptide deformylase